MNTRRPIVTWGYFLGWLLLALVGIIVGNVVFFIVMSAWGGGSGPAASFVASIIMTICFGTVIGYVQWLILRRYVHRSVVWIGVTLLGFLISCPVLLSLSGGFGPSITFQANLRMTVVLGCALGFTQWSVIRTKVNRSAMWIGISLISWVIAGIIGMALKTLSWEMGPIFYWLGLFYFGVVLSVVGMMWFLKQPTPPAT